MSTPESSKDEIPLLAGHQRRVFIHLALCYSGFLIGFTLAVASSHFRIPALEVVGIFLILAAGFAKFDRSSFVETARCPKCETHMSQGWNGKKTDGIFRCPRCQGQWRTPVIATHYGWTIEQRG